MEDEILNRMQAMPERRNPFDEGIAKAISRLQESNSGPLGHVPSFLTA